MMHLISAATRLGITGFYAARPWLKIAEPGCNISSGHCNWMSIR